MLHMRNVLGTRNIMGTNIPADSAELTRVYFRVRDWENTCLTRARNAINDALKAGREGNAPWRAHKLTAAGNWRRSAMQARARKAELHAALVARVEAAEE